MQDLYRVNTGNWRENAEDNYIVRPKILTAGDVIEERENSLSSTLNPLERLLLYEKEIVSYGVTKQPFVGLNKDFTFLEVTMSAVL
jgi:hypothetical protein